MMMATRRPPLLFCWAVLSLLLLASGGGAQGQSSRAPKPKVGVTPACSSLAKAAKNEVGCLAYETSMCDTVAKKCGAGLCAAIKAAGCGAAPQTAPLLPPDNERIAPIYLTVTNKIRLPSTPGGPTISGLCGQDAVPADSPILHQCGYDEKTRRFLSRLECPEGWVALQAVCVDPSAYPTAIPSITFRGESNCEFALPLGADHTLYTPVHNLACARA